MTELIENTSTKTSPRRKVVLPDVSTSHTGTLLPLHVMPKRTERVLLTFTRGENERLKEDVAASGMSKPDFIRGKVADGLDNLMTHLRKCQEDVDEALRLAVMYAIEDWTAQEIGRERHREQQGEEQEALRPGRRPRHPASHEERGFKRYTLRLTEKERERIGHAAEEIGLTPGGLIWRLLMGYPLFSLTLGAYESWQHVEEAAYSIKAALILADKGTRNRAK